MQQSAWKQQQYQQFDVRKEQYRKTWETDLKSACCKSPGFCLLAACCPQCVSYHVRQKALYDDMTRYICCNGDCPCSGRMSEQSCPEFCLCLEVFCCFAQSVASTRWLLQDEMQLQNTPCDNCLIGTMIAMQYLACICQIAACLSGSEELQAIADIVDHIADILWCSVCACMQTQHKVQINHRNNMGGPGTAPQQQQMYTAPGGPPGYAAQGPPGYAPQGGGYPQQPGYPSGPPPQTYPTPRPVQAGYPAVPPPQGGGGYPQQPPGYPPQGQGYPPQGYPQQGYPQQPPPGYPAPPQQGGMYRY